MNSPEAGCAGHAQFRTRRARDVVEHVDMTRNGDVVAAGGFWVVVGAFDGPVHAYRMATVESGDFAPEPDTARTWLGPTVHEWTSSLSHEQYVAGVERIRAEIRDGEVYQVNLCRVLSAPLPAGPAGLDAQALSHRLHTGNPARYSSRIVIPAQGGRPGQWVVSASPELYLAIEGKEIRSSPIKGTAAPGEKMLDKDRAENIMITDLVRNDLAHVATPGTLRVDELLGTHQLPGLEHLQSTVAAQLHDDFAWTERMWPALMQASFPPGSVSGAPKSSALRIIEREEPVARGPYCGAVGWIDADNQCAELAVGIRTFWWTPERGGRLNFGTGAGITWGSDPEQEWRETTLKASRLIALASRDTMSP